MLVWGVSFRRCNITIINIMGRQKRSWFHLKHSNTAICRLRHDQQSFFVHFTRSYSVKMWNKYCQAIDWLTVYFCCYNSKLCDFRKVFAILRNHKMFIDRHSLANKLFLFGQYWSLWPIKWVKFPCDCRNIQWIGSWTVCLTVCVTACVYPMNAKKWKFGKWRNCFVFFRIG